MRVCVMLTKWNLGNPCSAGVFQLSHRCRFRISRSLRGMRGVRTSRMRAAEQKKVLPPVSSLFGNAMLVVDPAVERACTDWAKPVDRPHHFTCWSVSDSDTDANHASADRSNQAAPPNDARLLLASESTFLKMGARQAVAAGARSIMGFCP